MLEMIWLIPVLPMLAALFIAVAYLTGKNRGEAGERFTSRIGLTAASASLLYILAIDVWALLQGRAPGQIVAGSWFASGEYTIRFSFLLDVFGLAITTLVALLSLLSLRFSVNYLHREDGFQRFFMVLSLFMGAMLLIVMAGNAVLAFVGWELAGVGSYLLIAYAFERTTASRNATRVFITNRIGDAGFIIALVLSFFWFGGVEWPTILDGAEQLSGLQAGLLAAAFLLAAGVKSAQAPFSPWISRALEGPTPSSAIFYGSLMVHAGVYLTIRLQPLLEQAPGVLAVLGFIGLLTALYGFFSGLVQTDVKSALIFSTVSQVGLMFLACGLGWFQLAAWHLAAHAVWRAYQFLNAPALMHLMSRPARPVPRWLQRLRWLYVASLQRFWLDNLADWLLVKPIRALAQDIQAFDQKVVNRMVGLPGSAGAVSSLAQWEEYKLEKSGRIVGDTGDIGHGSGVVGRLMQWLASLLYWFEEHLVLKGGEEGVQSVIQRTGGTLMKIEEFLSQPRYLLLLLMATFVVIL